VHLVIFIVVKLLVIERYLFRSGVLIFLHCFHETWLKTSTEQLLSLKKYISCLCSKSLWTFSIKKGIT